jgi:hypothetical protein
MNLNGSTPIVSKGTYLLAQNRTSLSLPLSPFPRSLAHLILWVSGERRVRE